MQGVQGVQRVQGVQVHWGALVGKDVEGVVLPVETGGLGSWEHH